jgi:hypothetical protein
MRPWLTFGVMGMFLAAAAPGRAAPSLDIRGVAARVTVIPEARGDIAVVVVQGGARLPIRMRRTGDQLHLTGDVGHRIHGCPVVRGEKGVAIWGRGVVPQDQLPQLVIRTPMAVRIAAGEAVFGEIGRGASVDFTNRGCGDWTIGDVQGRLRLNQSGSGDARAGSAGSGDLSVAATGGIVAGEIRGGLTAVSSGSGSIAVAAVFGAVDARVAGSGDIDLASGAVGDMTVSIAGSGAVRLRGSAQTLRAAIAGSGDVTVTRVTGAVSKQVFGSGAVRVGR